MKRSWILGILWCVCRLEICNGELMLVQAVFRHGDRQPDRIDSFYPKDPHINRTYGLEGPGSLTQNGKMVAFELGQYFRHRYGKLLGPVYSSRNVWFRADDIERIIASGQLVAAALYPPVKKQRWNPDLMWQPIPVWTVPLPSDYLYGGLFCESHRKMREEIEEKDVYLRKRREKMADFFEELSENTGANLSQWHTLFLYQHLYAQFDLGYELPNWAKPDFPKGELQDAAIFDLVIQGYTNEMKQLTSGVWIAEWLDHVEAHLNGSDSRRGFFYAAHDINVGAILVGLNNYDYRIPSYASAVIFELHKIDKKLYVQVIHRDSGYDRILEIPGCNSEMCPLRKFKKILSHLIPEDGEKMCGGPLNWDT